MAGMSTDLIDTTEMYLKTVLELEEEAIIPRRARIAERLSQSGPTVSQTVARMERDGLLELDEERILHLTAAGRDHAVAVMRKHRLAERLLRDVIGLPLHLVHDEACRWEHVMSVDVEKRLLGLLDGPMISPFGIPIPGLAGLEHGTDGDAETVRFDEFTPLVDAVPHGASAEVEVARIGEFLQTDPDLVELLARVGIVPGGRATVRRDGEEHILTCLGDEEVLLTDRDASHVFVTQVNL